MEHAQPSQQPNHQTIPDQIFHPLPPQPLSIGSDSGTPICHLLAHLFYAALEAYLWCVGITPAQSIEGASASGIAAAPAKPHPGMFEALWRECDSESWGLSRAEFDQILTAILAAHNLDLAPGQLETRNQQISWFRSLKLNDLVLARACAAANERAWEHFIKLYEPALVRAAIAITRSDSLGRELAGQLYADLYGLTSRDGQRRCPLLSYRGRGSLLGWLRTTLAQRHVDHIRRTRREEPIEEFDAPAADPEPPQLPSQLKGLRDAVQESVRVQAAEVRFLLASYYLDGRTLAQLAAVMNVHEATVSRKLHRAADAVRKQVLRNLVGSGLSKRAAQEALGTDPRDLHLQLKNILQNPPPETFQDEAAL
jgi:RNA polymerase sigma-70 factor (ECF subfamily)